MPRVMFRARAFFRRTGLLSSTPKFCMRQAHAQNGNKTTTRAVTKQFWPTRRTLACSALAASLVYTYDTQTPTNCISHALQVEPKYGTRFQLESAIAELRVEFGEDMVSTDDEDLKQHGFSEWSSINIDRLPTAVAYPRSTSDVSKIAQVCFKNRIPMIPYSGGSSLEANFSAPHGGMSIDFNNMDQIIALHADDMDVVVQPSVSWMSLNEEIKDSGLFFPVDPGPTAKIGGMVGTSCSGTNAVRYGTMKDWVVNLTVVLANGSVIKTRRRPRKTAAGYNLTNLFIGSEGTLGLVTEITLKLAVIPDETSVATVAFPTVRNAAEAATRIMRRGIPIAAMELMDEEQMRIINRTQATKNEWRELPTMFLKFSGTKAGVQENVAMVKSIAQASQGMNFQFASGLEEQNQLWSARKQALWSMHALRQEAEELWYTDVAVPLSRLADIVELSRKDLEEAGIVGSILGHVGDGNFHESVIFDPSDENKKATVQRLLQDQAFRALEMEGTCTGEHGVGLGKRDKLMKELGQETISVMQHIKFALDERWLMNPGKIFAHPVCSDTYGL